MLNALIWLDVQVFWLITLGNVRDGETISAACWHMHLESKWQGAVFVPIIDLLFRPWGRDHCRKAYVWQIHLYESKL